MICTNDIYTLALGQDGNAMRMTRRMATANSIEQRQVVIVGAGPVGLTLALSLARKGLDVLILERKARTAEHSRAPGIWSRSQQIFDELGVLERFDDHAIVLPRLQLWDADNDRQLIELPVEELRDETPYAQLMIVPQSTTERLLCDAVREVAEVRFSNEVTELEQDERGVNVTVRTPHGDRTIRALVVAGCDGAKSTVRDRIGGSLEGITYRMQAALADVRLRPDAELRFPRLTTRPHLAIGIRISSDLWRLILPFSGNAAPVALNDRVAGAVASLFPGRDYDTVWESEFKLHRRISTRWTERRIVLAGDAAHLNSPVGGQGMNAGILDAAALAGAISRAIDTGELQALERYASSRQHALKRGVNEFTDRLTRTLFSGRAILIRPMIRIGSLLLRIPPVRRRFLRKLTMLSSG